MTYQLKGTEIAVIGLAGRFPGSQNTNMFWRNLRDGIESISFINNSELESLGLDSAVINDSNYVKAGAVLEDIHLFDASFFGYNPREAELTDPQQRLFLECAWESLENAGYDSVAYRGLIGVYAGMNTNSYLLNNISSNRNHIKSVDSFLLEVGNEKDYLATRVSYKLNLEGPSIVIQSACSTSLVAIHVACQGLLSGECDMALAGGVSIRIPEKVGYFYQEGGILSPDGHCRAFDAKAQGTVPGNGVGIVVLKRMADALADGDQIYAVIKGSAINNDGSLKVGYTAPRVESQAKVVIAAQALAEIEPETVTYIEAHGTGTSLGDPIEIAALTQAFGASTDKKGFCAIGSVKTNVGHLDTAAGVTGLIKTILALKHKLLPPSLHFEEPNPQIDFANSPFYVNTKLREWKADKTPLRAGVSSFGIGGTNAHVILEEAPAQEPSGKSRPYQLLLLSAKTNSALNTATANLIEHLQQHQGINLADTAYTLAVGRKAFSYRRMLVCQEPGDAVSGLETSALQGVFTNLDQQHAQSVVFMFPGQGAQYLNMGLELYELEPVFRQQVDMCSEILKPTLGLDLRCVLYPKEEQATQGASELEQTAVTQPALFVVEYALAKLWRSWGVHPQAMVGHSIGEYVCACLSGVLSLEDALCLVVARGQMMQQLAGGAMLAIPLPESEVLPLLNQEVCVAAINGPNLCVVSGTTDAVKTLESDLGARGLECRRLHTSHAFHSQMMEPILEPFTEQVKKLSLRPPQIPYMSNVTGTWITAEQATAPSYWATHLRSPVRFAEGIQQLLKQPELLLLEVGPGRTLSTLATRHPDKTPEQVVLCSLHHPQHKQSDVAFLLNTLGQLWLAGVHIDWSQFYSHQRRYRLPLPTYPLERQRFWIEPQKETEVVKTSFEALPAISQLTKNSDIAKWFYIPSWQRSLLPVHQGSEKLVRSCWLAFIDECGLGFNLVEKLKQESQDVIIVRRGEEFTKLNDSVYTLNPQQSNEYNVLLSELCAQEKIPTKIVHLWSVTPNAHTDSGLEGVEKAQNLGFYSLLFLAQALGKQNFTDELQLTVVSNNVQEVTGEESLCPAKATLLGPVKVIPLEYTNINCCSIDIVLPYPGSWQENNLLNYLVAELMANNSEKVVAYRGNHRWVQTISPIPLEKSTNIKLSRLREEGVYLITGGIGGIGLALAEHLAKTVRAKLILTGRSVFPAREKWEQWLVTHDNKDKLYYKIKKLQEIEALGSEIMVLSADVANLEEMKNAVSQAEERFGQINGVIHAAGIPGAGFIQLKTPEMVASVFAPKVKGTLVLEKVFQNRNLDFLILFSTTTSITGEIGQLDYCTANAFLDAFAHYNSSVKKIFTIAINWGMWQWDAWQEQLMASIPEIQNQLKQMRETYGMTFPEGIDAFSRILNTAEHQVIVSTQNFQDIIKQANNFTISSLLENVNNVSRTEQVYPRPNLSNPYIAPRNEVEQTVINIWQELLGIEPVGIQDSFLELGGDSLLAVQMMSRLRVSFQIELPLSIFFETPTVVALANLIVEKTEEQKNHEELAQILEDIENLSTNEIQEELTIELQKQEVNLSTIDFPESKLKHPSEIQGKDLKTQLFSATTAENLSTNKKMKFSLFYFSGDGEKTTEEKYYQLLETVKYADKHQFSAVWTPERHFQKFGGLYPNPSVLSAALAMVTKQIQIRAGSLVLPLHNPIRVAEDWSIVDNLSGGRVGISFATGWHPNDFVLSPGNYENRKEIMFSEIQTIQKLWRGERINFQGVEGKDVEVKTLPKPLQPEIPIWVTSSGNTEIWVKAGKIGVNILAGLISQPFDDLKEKIVLYRESLATHGYDPNTGQVTVMLHTFIGEDIDEVREKVRKPLCTYLEAYMGQYASSTVKNVKVKAGRVSQDDKDALISQAFEHYFNTKSLLGTPKKCAQLIEQLKEIGVDEIACLIDFGLDFNSVMESLYYLNHLTKHYDNIAILNEL